MYVYIYIYICITNKYLHIQTHTLSCIHMHIDICVYDVTTMYANFSIYTCIYACTCRGIHIETKFKLERPRPMTGHFPAMWRMGVYISDARAGFMQSSLRPYNSSLQDVYT